MNLGIAGKVALVTAAGAGLGKAVAHALAAEGVNLVLFSRSADRLHATANEVKHEHHTRVVAVEGDMRVVSDVERLVGSLKQEFGAPDIFVLNTGRPPTHMRAVLDETEDERWVDAYQTQLLGAILVARSVVPMMLGKGWGRVIAITSATVKQPMKHHGLSTVYRAGVTAYMKHLANELALTGITVNTVCPGSIDTPTGRTEAENEERRKRVPIGRLGRPRELAAAVAFLASVDAAFITGASLHVDGGMVGSLY